MNLRDHEHFQCTLGPWMLQTWYFQIRKQSQISGSRVVRSHNQTISAIGAPHLLHKCGTSAHLHLSYGTRLCDILLHTYLPVGRFTIKCILHGDMSYMHIESVSATTFTGWQEPLYIHVCMTGRIPEWTITDNRKYSLLCLLCKQHWSIIKWEPYI